MKLPELNFSGDRMRFKNVYDNYSSDLHRDVVKAWLFDDLSHRRIDSEILNLDSDFTHGFESMNILHYFGINEEFKKEFKAMLRSNDIESIIFQFELCSDSNYDEFIRILKMLNNNKFNISIEDIPNLLITQDVLDKVSAALISRKNIILEGVPGTGKTYLATKFAEKSMGDEGYILTTATSDWTTFDTIGGLMPNENGELVFHEGKFLQAIRENKWLIIDEINRADIDKSFGQLFTVLSGQNVELPYSIKDLGNEEKSIKIKLWEKCHSDYVENEATYYIGKNWRIIATMNSYDKNSLFDLSYAFMRRFTFIEIEVPKKFKELIELWTKNKNLKEFIQSTKKFIDKLESVYSINYGEESKVINRQIGPAIFLDIIKYLNYRLDIEGNNEYDDKILSEAINAFIIPQFEGLSREKLDILKEFFINKVFDDENNVKSFYNKLNDLKPFY